jgi:acetoin utilization deacetylase AcuC-like enzyme
MGFCFFNNVAVAARHALDVQVDCNACAIIDFDVHHGNGTEDIFAGDDRMLMSAFSSTRSIPTAVLTAAGNMVNVPVPARSNGQAVRDVIESLLDVPPGGLPAPK